MPIKPVEPQASPAVIYEAKSYGVRLQPAADLPAGVRYWQVTNVRHLSANENRGRRNIFEAIARIKTLMATHAERSGARPDTDK